MPAGRGLSSRGSRPLLTVGHGTAGTQELAGLLRGAGVDLVVDVRRFPGSRAHPHLARDVLAQSLPASGLSYRWEERLGGRRRLDRTAPSPDTWWTVEAFRAYAAHTRSADFSAALAGVLTDLRDCSVAVMCSESLWWRCHRRLIADVTVLTGGCEVRHLMPGGALVAHRPAAGARLREDGQVAWDGGAVSDGSDVAGP